MGCCAADDTPLWDSFFPRQRPLESSAVFAALFICLVSAFPPLFLFFKKLFAWLDEAGSAEGVPEAVQHGQPRSSPSWGVSGMDKALQ